MRRFFDMLISIVLLAMMAPLLVLIAVVIVTSSGRPVLFRQLRIGKGGRDFEIIKFRTMVKGADKLGPHYTSSNDSRITRVGRVLRRFSLDEIPQFFNVLQGQMSLIGPRPAVPAQRELYSTEEWERRHSVLPGITGLAQATLRSTATHEQLKALDTKYVQERSCLLDLKILGLTIRQILQTGGN